MQAEKITSIHGVQEIQLLSGTIEAVNEKVFQILGPSGYVSASKAFSCLVEPEVEDVVLFSINTLGQCHVLSIIERPEHIDASIEIPGSLSLKAHSGDITFHAQQGISINSEKNISLATAEYSLLANKAMFGIDNLSAIGTTLVAKIKRVHTIADTVETVADNLLQKLKNSFRVIAGVEQTKSGDVIHTVKNLYSMRSRQAAILAKKDIKVDAERIHMG